MIPTTNPSVFIRMAAALSEGLSFTTMFNDAEKEELRRIVNKFVEQRRCFRPIHPDDVLKEVDRFKRMETSLDELESTEIVPRFQM